MSAAAKRLLVLQLINNGVTNPIKLAELAGVCRATAYNIIRRAKDGRGAERKPAGRPKVKVTGRLMQSLIAFARNNRKLGFRKIARRFSAANGITIGHETARRALKTAGYRSRRAHKVPLMTDAHKAKRVDFCRLHHGSRFENCFFTDESMFQLGGNKLHIISKDVPQVQVSKFPPRVMVWGGISSRGSTVLKIVSGSVNSEAYCNILDECLVTTASVLYPDGWCLQQDNARAHTAAATTHWLQDHGIRCMAWPAASPDLNPIENIWGLMKTEVEQRAPRTLAELKSMLPSIWGEVTDTYALGLIASVPGRLEACIRKNGECVSH